MVLKREIDPILAVWQAELHYAVEAGLAPQITLGGDSSSLSAIVALEALRALTESRGDSISPLVSAGGSSGAWLSALTQPPPASTSRLPAGTTLFTGADAASQLASGATLPLHPSGLRPARDRQLPGGYRDLLLPAVQPAIPFAWESLPLRALEPPAGGVAGYARGGWLGRAALVLAFILILGALIL